MDNILKNVIFEKFKYDFKNDNLLKQAFTRKSYAVEQHRESNEVLEFLGDRVLDYIVTKKMLEKYSPIKKDDYFKSEYSEGFYTELKKTIVNGKTLSKKIEELDLNKYLIVNKSDKQGNVINEDSVKEDLFEALIGAITIDINYDIEQVEKIIENVIDFDIKFNDFEKNYQKKLSDEIIKYKDRKDNYVGCLNEMSQKGYIFKPQYEYEQVKEKWKCSCTINKIEFIGKGKGNSKKNANNLAAKKMLEHIIQNTKERNKNNE